MYERTGSNPNSPCACCAQIQSVVAGAFFFLIISYCMYDRFVQARTENLKEMATKSNEIISSLFPKAVRDRLYNDKDEPAEREAPLQKKHRHEGLGRLSEEDDEEMAIEELLEDRESPAPTAAEVMDEEGFMYKSKPIADVYPETTVSLFA